MQKPGRRFFGGTRTPGAQDRGRGAQKFCLHEQIAEGGMRLIRRLGREHHFGVTG